MNQHGRNAPVKNKYEKYFKSVIRIRSMVFYTPITLNYVHKYKGVFHIPKPSVATPGVGDSILFSVLKIAVYS